MSDSESDADLKLKKLRIRDDYAHAYDACTASDASSNAPVYSL